MGIEYLFDGLVNINIGGKIFSIDKNYFKEKFEYFDKFFDNYDTYSPNYNDILIDRSYVSFQQLLDYLSGDQTINFIVKQELDYFLWKETEINEYIELNKIDYVCHHMIRLDEISKSLIPIQKINTYFIMYGCSYYFYKRDKLLMT